MGHLLVLHILNLTCSLLFSVLNPDLVGSLDFNNRTPQTFRTSAWSLKNIWNTHGNSVLSTFPYALNNINSQHCFFLFLWLHEVQSRSWRQNLSLIKKKCKDTKRKQNVKSFAGKCSLERTGVWILAGKRSLLSIVHLTPTNDLVFSVHNTSKHIWVMDLAKKKKR